MLILRLIPALLLLLAAATAWAAPVAFEDVNCNGVFDAGDIVIPKVAPAPFMGLEIFSEHCLVIPKNSVSTGAFEYIYIEGLKDVTFGAAVKTKTGPNDYGDAFIKGGTSLTVLPGAHVTSAGPVYVGANKGPLMIGDDSTYKSTKDYVHLIGYHEAGTVLGEGIDVYAVSEVDIRSHKGSMVVGRGLNVSATKGPVTISGRTGVDIDRATLKGFENVDIDTMATPLIFTNSQALLARPATGFVNITSRDRTQPCCVLGPVDVTGSRFPHGEVFISGDPIVR